MNNENSNEDYVDDVILTEEKKERVLKELHEEIEMQKAKYLLNGVHRDTEENNNVESNDDHYATLSKAKENLNQIQNDLNSYSLQNETSNDNYTYQIHNMTIMKKKKYTMKMKIIITMHSMKRKRRRISKMKYLNL